MRTAATPQEFLEALRTARESIFFRGLQTVQSLNWHWTNAVYIATGYPVLFANDFQLFLYWDGPHRESACNETFRRLSIPLRVTDRMSYVLLTNPWGTFKAPLIGGMPLAYALSCKGDIGDSFTLP